MTNELIRKEWLQVFYKGELFIIHKDYKKDLEEFLRDNRTTNAYIQRKYGESFVK